MAWIIDKDHIKEPGARPGTNLNATGLRGFGKGSLAWSQGLKDDDPRLKYHFKMLDDDGILYYEGRNTEPDDPHPLDAFGMPNSGCTTIAYRDKKGLYREL